MILWMTAVLVLAAFSVGPSSVMGASQDTYSIALQGFLWDKTSLNALIVTSYNDSWWSSSDIDIALRAVGQWNDAIAAFAQNYSEYSYLSDLRIQTTVSNESLPGYDIYISWSDMPLSNSSDEVGLSLLATTYQGTISNCTVQLSTRDFHGDALVEGDMQNIALHELGHSLGLGHSNYTDDLMYYSYTIGSPAKAVSTLDVYGVATLFSWELEPANFHPYYGWLKVNSVVLPDTIPYRGLPVSKANQRPDTLANNAIFQFFVLMLGILIHPEIFATVLAFFVICVIIAVYPSKRRRKKSGG